MIIRGVDLQTNDSGLASYVAGQIDRSLSWKVRWLFIYKISRNMRDLY